MNRLTNARSHGWRTERIPDAELPPGSHVPCLPHGGDWHVVGTGLDGLPCILASCLTLASAMLWRERLASGCDCGPLRVERHAGESRQQTRTREKRYEGRHGTRGRKRRKVRT